MKYQKIFAILIFGSVLTFFACNNNTNSSKNEPLKPFEASDLPTSKSSTNQNNATTEASQNTEGVWHYTCSKGCAGGAGSAVNCNNCGSLLVHNQAYHAKANNTNSTPSSIPFMNPPTAESGKNTAGVWHYTCEKGCAGGAGAAGNCSTCSSPLVHNAAYHQ